MRKPALHIRWSRAALGVAALFSPWCILAADVPPTVPTHELGGMGQLLQVTLGLIAVLAAILAVAWIARRTGAIRGAANGQLRVLGAMSMGPRERVVLVQVGETQLLVGIAPGQVRTLHVLDKPVALEHERELRIVARSNKELQEASEAPRSDRGNVKTGFFGNSFAAKLEAALSERMANK